MVDKFILQCEISMIFRRALYLILVLSFVLTPSGAAALDQRFVDVVSVTWPGALSHEVSVEQLSTEINNEVNRYWRSLSTFQGGSSELTFNFVFGKTLTSDLELNAPIECEGSKFAATMAAIRAEFYKRLSTENFRDRYLIISIPESGCIWEGKAFIGEPSVRGGTIVLQDTRDPFVIAHELGHTLGLGHSNYMRCESGLREGPWGICRAIEYGGAVDLMGNVPTDGPLSTYHQWRLGLIKTQQIKQVWQTEVVSLSAVDVESGIKSIFVRDGASTYWIEFRRAEIRRGYRAGVVIYRTDPPPTSSISSPNQADYVVDGNRSVSTDMWLLNLDNYNYSNSQTTGSMSLTLGKKFSVFSGNVIVEPLLMDPTLDSATIRVSITPDKMPPPRPKLSDFGNWRFSNANILEDGYQDEETEIAAFEISNSSTGTKVITGIPDTNWRPTFLEPLVAPKILTAGELPEGNYELAVRTIDLAGNRSDWSETRTVTIDRGHPELDERVIAESISDERVTLKFAGLKDEGSSLCSTVLYGSSDFVQQRSQQNVSPSFEFPLGIYETNIQTFDCLGNGLNAKIKTNTKWNDLSRNSKVGKWSKVQSKDGRSYISCIQKCTISISASGSLSILGYSGSGELLVSGRRVSTFDSNSKLVERILSVELGPKKKLVRITGKNLNLAGVIESSVDISDKSPINNLTTGTDPTLSLTSQRDLIGLGFRQSDFVNGWIVLPMPGGVDIGDPTLDFCGTNYPSERDRTNRRQLVVSRAGNPYQFFSSESVKYRNSESSIRALNELITKVIECKQRGGVENEAGILTKYTFLNTQDLNNDVLIQNRVRLHVKIGEGVSAITLFAVYQFEGEFFSGLYVVKGQDKNFTIQEIRSFEEMAEVFASRLKTMRAK